MTHRKVTTVADERTDTAHETSYVIKVRVGNRGINEDQREAFAKLVRRCAKEITVFAGLIAGPNQVKEASLHRVSSASGSSDIDYMSEDIDG